MIIIHLLYMDNNEIKKISKMYENLTYFDQYGGSLLLFIIITIILFIFASYCFVMINVEPIKNDWVNQRCKPYIIPFAGMINKPDDMTSNEFTKQNYNYCVQNIVSGISGSAVQPLTFIMDTVNRVFDFIKETINIIREMVNKVRNQLESISKELMGRIMNITIPLQQIIIAMRDMMGKIQGTMTSGLFTLLGSYYTLKSLMGAIVEFIIIILIALAVIIAIFWIIPFTWGVAAFNTGIFVAISIPLAIILVFMTKVLNIQPNLSIPKLKCFDKDTYIMMNNGTKKKISEIKIGDILDNNNKVTGIVKVEAEGSIMFKLHDIVVSDTHIVRYKNIWLPVFKHPDSVLIDDYKEPYLYCLNTSSKEIIINNTCFTDWDEVYNESIQTLKNNSPIKFNETEDIHKYLDGGFHGETIVHLENDSTKKMKDIQIGDILKNNIIVYGIVKIDGKELNEQCSYHIENNIIRGGPNLIYQSKSDNFMSTIYLDKNNKELEKKEDILYHLLTDTETFYINNIQFNDYNSLINTFLIDKNEKF